MPLDRHAEIMAAVRGRIVPERQHPHPAEGQQSMLAWLQQEFFQLLNVIMIDVVLAGDNAIIVGLAASRVAPEIRSRVIFWGIAGAVLLRVAFAGITAHLLTIVGLTLAGGILLLWVCWKMYRQLTNGEHDLDDEGVATGVTAGATMTFGQAVSQVILADVTMSLDNVLAVAGSRPDDLRRADGRRIAFHRPAAGTVPVGHLDRLADRRLRCIVDDQRRYAPSQPCLPATRRDVARAADGTLKTHTLDAALPGSITGAEKENARDPGGGSRAAHGGTAQGGEGTWYRRIRYL
jgi:YjbE family integral membrane protein